MTVFLRRSIGALRAEFLFLMRIILSVRSASVRFAMEKLNIFPAICGLFFWRSGFCLSCCLKKSRSVWLRLRCGTLRTVTILTENLLQFRLQFLGMPPATLSEENLTSFQKKILKFQKNISIQQYRNLFRRIKAGLIP